MNRDKTVQQAIEGLLEKTAHPDTDELVAYHEGTLSPGDAQRVQDHLVACRECAGLLADLEGLGDPEFGAEEEVPDNAGEIVWEKVREEIRRDTAPKVIPFRREESGRAAIPRWFQALAASLLVATVGLSLWVADLREDLKRPQPNAPFLDLYPAGSTRGEGVSATQAVPSDVRLFTVVLHPGGRAPFEEYEVEILDANGQEVGREPGLKLNPDSVFTLALSRDLLGPGEFRVRLVGIDPGGGRQTVEEYAFRVEK